MIACYHFWSAATVTWQDPYNYALRCILAVLTSQHVPLPQQGFKEGLTRSLYALISTKTCSWGARIICILSACVPLSSAVASENINRISHDTLRNVPIRVCSLFQGDACDSVIAAVRVLSAKDWLWCSCCMQCGRLKCR